MKPKNILSGLSFVREVTGKTQTYYVYEGKNDFILMTVSKSKNSCNFNVVPKEAADYVKTKFTGRQKITTNDVVKESKKPIYIKGSLDALNILYALCATGAAKIDSRIKQKQLFFNIKR
jgi:hypothetical protein